MRDHSFPDDVTINRILVVDENREQAEQLGAFLRQHHFHVDVTRDAGQSHATFHLHPPDFVILEAILPNDVSGFELCEWIKHQDSTVPVVMQTVIDRDDARALARRVGVDAYLLKPCPPEKMLEQLLATENLIRQRWQNSSSSGADALIRFACQGCGKSLKVNPVHRGRAFHCPKCGKMVMVPAN